MLKVYPVAAGLLICASMAGADVLLRVRPHVVVQPDSDIRLLQLLDANGMSAEAVKKLGDTTVAKAPAYGDKQEIAIASFMPVLRDIVENERKHTQVHLVIPKTVAVDTLKREISADLVGLELTQAWQPLCADCKLSVEGLSLPKVEGIRDWTLKVKPELPRGTFSVAVDLIRENGSVLPAWVSGRLITKRKVPVARKVFIPGERIQAQDVNWEYRDTAYSYDGVPAANELANKRIRQGLRAGDIVWRGMLEKEKAIHRGELVQVRSAEAGWEVTLSMVAQQDAYVGDAVNLKNPKTNSTLVGEVTGQGEVELR
jgi:flagella basal body P-ring formation protein FlgA